MLNKGRVSDYTASLWMNNFKIVYVALHSSDPDVDSPVFTEINGGSYQRIKSVMHPVSSRAMWITADTKWVNLPGGLVTHIGLWDKQIGGNILASAPLSSPTRVIAGTGYSINGFDITISIA